MGKKIFTFGDIEIEKNKNKTPFFLGDVDIKKALVSNEIFFVKKTISTLLATCVMVIRLNHYI